MKKNVKIFGTGCTKCNKLEENAKKALDNLGIDYNIEHVTDFIEISKYGIMSTPALSIDDKILVAGKVASIQEIEQMI